VQLPPRLDLEELLMSDQNVPARFAVPSTSGIVAGVPYLGRVVTASRSFEGSAAILQVDGIEVYAGNNKDPSHPTTIAGQGKIFGGQGGFLGDQIFGAPTTHIHCIVTFDEHGDFSLTLHGIDYAWFEPSGTNPTLWAMKGRNGISQGIQCEDGVECLPFDPPWGGAYDPSTHIRFYSESQPVFVAATGIDASGSEWRAEYQACKADDPDNDTPPGIRSPWNLLSENCCKGPDDGGGTGGGGGGGGGNGPCDNLNLNCAVQCKACFRPNALPFRKWCLIDGLDACNQQTAGRCFCSATQINGDPLPDPNTVPPGAVLVVKCSDSPSRLPLCSNIAPPGSGYFCPR
jgi:hypothetical protein